MKIILLLCTIGLSLALRAQQSDDIPTVTLPQIGAGPALLIFVSDYTDAFPPLPGVLKDKPAMLATVKQLGFTDVTVMENPAKEAMKTAMSDFGRSAAKTSKASFFYFSGHGVLNNRLNYLIPANAPIETQGHLDLYAVPAEHVTGFVAGKKSAGPCLFFVDACRNNELPADEKSSEGDGVAFQRQAGMFIGYATDEGKTSGLTDQGSFFTASLAKRLLTAGRSLDDVFAGVIADVEAAPQKEKQPPQKESRLRYVLHLVPDDGDELARLRRENEALKRGSPRSGGVPPLSSPSTGMIDTPGAGTQTATKDAPFVNAIGMKFVPVVSNKNGEKVLFSIWETRRQDYAAYAAKNSDVDTEWKAQEYQGVPVGQKDDEPVVSVSWEDATAFCAWLTETERAGGRIGAKDEYRLPTDMEWSYAVGIGEKEDASATPEAKHAKFDDVYPWGKGFPPPANSGNYADSSAKAKFSYMSVIKGYRDGYATTSPVGTYEANSKGLYDLGGNVWEWCGDWSNAEQKYRVLRGSSWVRDIDSDSLSSLRFYNAPANRSPFFGFRCVLVVGGG